MFKKCNNLKMLFIVMAYSFTTFATVSTFAQDSPFDCDENAYLFQVNDVFSIDLASGSSFQIATDIVSGSVNAVAYNPTDDFIWGSISTPAKSIVRIDKDFKTTSYTIDGLPDNGQYVGDINTEGIYFLKGGGSSFYTVDLNPASPSYLQFQDTLSLSENISIHDWAFNAVDNMLYSVARNTNVLYRINPADGQVTALGEVPILSGLTYNYGAVYFDSDGRFYLSANQTGTIYVIQSVQDVASVADMDSNLFAFGPSSSSNDGARCPTAAVLQEICENGIDDDLDGLIDCEDPSCSGFGVCEVIEAPTSGSNSGGLESNSRLSDKINARNFNRARTGYQFDQLTARRIKPDVNYARSNPDAEINLPDFMPLNIIEEDEVIEATPSDLLQITNATEVFSVDYLKNDKSVASVLALKTESGVYEHTKYICDRLLGAELISVSTITIKEQEFIKSIIRNEQGTVEFVLSFSARLMNEDTEFAVESHWNLDKYQEKATYYNFQIWSNEIDDLYTLGSAVLDLLEVQRPISGYDTSTPPPVFVRKGAYTNGTLSLQIVNSNKAEYLIFDAGYRETETSDFKTASDTFFLNGDYIIDIDLDTDHLFDIGFRIGDGVHTPDDIFLSDGPWGVDGENANTTVTEYEVSQNDFEFEYTDFPVERNVYLTANTDTYVAAYRALTARYRSVDLTAYQSLNFDALGTGVLEVTLLKAGVKDWEDQYKAYLVLSDEKSEYSLAMEDFTSPLTGAFIADDIVSIVFTLVSESGEMESKSMRLENVRFSQDLVLSTDKSELETRTVTAYPNPMSTKTNIQFALDQAETVEIVLYDQLGKVVYSATLSAESGLNQAEINRQNLTSGLYFATVRSQHSQHNTIKLVVN